MWQMISLERPGVRGGSPQRRLRPDDLGMAGRIVAMQRRGWRQRTRHLMPQQRSVVPDTKLSQGAGGEPVRVLLTGSTKLDDPQRDKFGYLIYRSGGKFKFGAHSVERPVHGLNVFGLVGENTGSGPGHRGVTDVLSGHAPDDAMLLRGAGRYVTDTKN